PTGNTRLTHDFRQSQAKPAATGCFSSKRNKKQIRSPTCGIKMIWSEAFSAACQVSLECAVAPFLVADTDGFVDSGEKNLAVADPPRFRRPGDGLDGAIHSVVRQHCLDLDLGQEVDGVLVAAIDLRVTLLPAVTPHVGDGHAVDTDLLQRVFDGFKS